ncbi:sugar transporter ERD6-like 8 [Rosa chinensis]|uniref:sugar transporter ERD6-like 8 n=1 Tax=Rosa chinensis TaxID=74649 RepID=UPI001AD91D66|nr:sugar transporter ERD6-like 8 [Rosa chinensis]
MGTSDFAEIVSLDAQETCHWIQEEGVEKEAKWLMFSCGRIRSYQEHCSSSSQEKQIPSKVKDGVSESQFNQVLNIELDQIIETNQAVRMSATFYITGWLAIYFSEGAWSLDIGRFLTGYISNWSFLLCDIHNI